MAIAPFAGGRSAFRGQGISDIHERKWSGCHFCVLGIVIQRP